MDKSRFQKIVFIFLTCLGVLCSVQWMLADIYLDGQPPSWKMFVMTFPIWWFWFLFLPAIQYLNKRFRITPPFWARGLSVHFISSLLFTLAHLGIWGLWRIALTPNAHWELFPQLFTQQLLRTGWPHLNIAIYWCILGMSYFFEYLSQIREKENQALHLEASLQQAQLTAIKSRLHPHFIFNTLNALSTLQLRGDMIRAQRVLEKFALLLRKMIDEHETHMTPLKDEIAFVALYLELEKERFQERLTAHFAIEETCESILVPRFLLQPLVENAIKHGIAQTDAPGAVNISARRDLANLTVEVVDNGPGLVASKKESEPGIGLENTRSLLKNIYGDSASLTLEDRAEGGCVATITIAFAGIE